MMQCMMRCNGEFSGFVGFDECTGNRLWTEEEVTALTRLSELIGIFLSKKRAQQRANRNLRRMTDCWTGKTRRFTPSAKRTFDCCTSIRR